MIHLIIAILAAYNVLLTFKLISVLNQRDDALEKLKRYVPRNIGVSADGSTWYTRMMLEKEYAARSCIAYDPDEYMMYDK